MLIKTSELTGAALDWTVGECTKVNTYMVNYYPPLTGQKVGRSLSGEGMTSTATRLRSVCVGKIHRLVGVPSWRAKLARCGVGSDMFYGPTPLIAAPHALLCRSGRWARPSISLMNSVRTKANEEPILPSAWETIPQRTRSHTTP